MPQEERTELGAGDGGRWLVETVTGSRHLIDLDAMTYARQGRRLKLGGGLDTAETREILQIESMPKLNGVFRLVLSVDDPELAEFVDSSFVVRISRHEGSELSTDVLATSAIEDVAETLPVNAWLLLGDEASYPSPDELQDQRADENPELTIWTAPRQILRGDLVFIYFVSPRKAIHFAARALCAPFYDPTIEVNALKRVDPHQWWTILSPLVRVPPVPYSRLKELHGGHLVLQGKPTNYVTPPIVRQVIGEFGDLDDEQRLVLHEPIGDPDLPNPAEIDLDALRRIAGGTLHPETKVEQYVAEPLLRLCFQDSSEYRVERQLKIPDAGVADYGVFRADQLIGVVEVKVGVRRRPGGQLQGSPDLEQALRYADAAQVPALLVDANEIILVAPGVDSPVGTYGRRQLTVNQLSAIASHFSGAGD